MTDVFNEAQGNILLFLLASIPLSLSFLLGFSYKEIIIILWAV